MAAIMDGGRGAYKLYVGCLSRRVVVAICLLAFACGVSSQSDDLFDFYSLTKFKDAVPQPPRVQAMVENQLIKVNMVAAKWNFHSDLGKADVFAFALNGKAATFPGPTFEARSGRPVQVQWVNKLPDKHIFPIDPTLDVPSVKKGVPTVIHMHGFPVEPASDGHPLAWYTANYTAKGPTFKKAAYNYSNAGSASMAWYHDHAMGMTTQNVLAGLAGMWLIRDRYEAALSLPTGQYERELMIGDINLHKSGKVFFFGQGPTLSDWVSEQYGFSIMVNGKIWPHMDVFPARYRFRIVNAALSRVFTLGLDNGAPFSVIGWDSAFIAKPTAVTSFTIGPGQRADVIVDFSASAGKKIVLTNSAGTPYPTGDYADPNSVGVVMQFRVKAKKSMTKTEAAKVAKFKIPKSNPFLSLTQDQEALAAANVRRQAILVKSGPHGPLVEALNGRSYDVDARTVTTKPFLGSVEIWEYINLTPMAHPMHTHLVSGQVISRRPLKKQAYIKKLPTNLQPDNINPNTTKLTDQLYPDPANFLGDPLPLGPEDQGWRDTVLVNPKEVTRVAIQFSGHTYQESASFPFDATADPGYAWHCHILTHEDNSMMRQLSIVKAQSEVQVVGRFQYRRLLGVVNFTATE